MIKKGLVLILVLGILVVLIVIGSAVVNLTTQETRLVKFQNNSIRAFYLAEAGIEDAIGRLKKGDDTTPVKGSLYTGVDEYDVEITGDSPSYTVRSRGSYPSLTALDKVTREIQVDVEVTPNGDPSRVVNAIEANGEIKVSGAVAINGGVSENTTLDFEYIFGITPAEMEAMADHNYTDPPNNQMPVDKITWVNLSSESSFRISQTGWTGSGILVVKEPSGSTTPALEIEGGVFNGVIWVIGNLRISGNAIINGAIFVENGSAEVTRLTGTPAITYDFSVVEDAFKYLGNTVTDISNWQEIQ
jgi:hypothetical protein